MATTRHTHIDALPTLGQELAEEHLAIATGGRRIVTGGPTYSSDGKVIDCWRD